VAALLQQPALVGTTAFDVAPGGLGVETGSRQLFRDRRAAMRCHVGGGGVDEAREPRAALREAEHAERAAHVLMGRFRER
jgi:hypothetical protein